MSGRAKPNSPLPYSRFDARCRHLEGILQQFQNVTYALRDGLKLILAEGETITVRGSQVRELRPHAIRIERPLERLYVLPHRRNNVFAAIAETLWVMAGRDDIAFLSRYLPRAAQFSDDGETWRGAYGPRLRHWQGVDQFKEVAELLNQDPNSRRAVMSLFDPARDFADSRDIPCNNWLHFMIRDGQLHLHVTLRSCDAVWGFSGINTFEWSVLHEMMAFWTGVPVGEAVYFISSFHLYERHYERAAKIVNFQSRTLYDHGFSSPRFGTSLADLDAALTQCFSIEESFRRAEPKSDGAIADIQDDFLRACMQMLALYASFLVGSSAEEINRRIESLPTGDFKVAAIEYFSRGDDNEIALVLSEREAKFFINFNADASLAPIATDTQLEPLTLRSVLQVLSGLHREKTRVYKDSWKKRGEVLGILANISRKYDRLEVIVGEGVRPSNDESLFDTVADLAIYAAKYLTFLAEREPESFQAFVKQYPTALPIHIYADNLHGFDAVAAVLIQRHDQTTSRCQSEKTEAGFAAIREAYQAMETLLLSGKKQESERKCVLAAELSIGALRFLMSQAEEDPYGYEAFLKSVQTL